MGAANALGLIYPNESSRLAFQNHEKNLDLGQLLYKVCCREEVLLVYDLQARYNATTSPALDMHILVSP